MKWFKFYGQDFLTDPKMRVLTIEEKMVWIVLLCVANAEDKNGRVSFVNEEEVMRQASVDEGSPMWEATKGFLERFQELGMLKIEHTAVTRGGNAQVTSSKMLRYNIFLTHFESRQNRDLTPAEKQKNYRERLKTKTSQGNESYRAEGNESYPRLDKNRIEKEVAAATSSLPVLEVKLDHEGKEKQQREKRTVDPAWGVRAKLYSLLAKELGKPPIESVADLKMVQRALKTLTEKQVLEMFEETLSAKTVYTVREVLTDRQVEIYRQEL